MANHTNFTNDIDRKIYDLIIQCFDEEAYSNIMEDLFKKGLFSPSVHINSLNYLPNFNQSQLQNNFLKNMKKITTFIQTSIKPNTEIYYVLSCIYGAFLGDAMGAFCEFQKPNPNNSRNIFGPKHTVIGGLKGQITDDSEMALSLAFAIMDTPFKNQLNANYIYFYYGAWFKTNPLDFGNTTKSALKHFNFRQYQPALNNFQKIEHLILKDNHNSLSNGFLMRKSTFIAWLYYRFYYEISEALAKKDNISLFNLYKKIKDLSAEDNRCTNPSEDTNIISGIYCLMALMALQGFQANDIINKIIELYNIFISGKGNSDENRIIGIFLNYIKIFSSQDFDFYKYFGDLKSKENVYTHMGFYLHAFKLTLYFLCQFNAIAPNAPDKKYREIMEHICNLGGDTDTNCCIVGAIIGPLIGMNNFGENFKEMLNLIPINRPIYCAPMAVLLVIYLKKSNRDNNLIQNDKYFLQQLLTLLYGSIDLSY